MKNHFLSIIILLMLVSCQISSNENPIPKVEQGKIVRLENLDFTEIEKRPVDVWLPNNYNKSKKYPVIYMHDGQMLFDKTITWNKQEWDVDSVLQNLIDKQNILECIVVGIWNTEKRHNEYFPEKVFDKIPKTYLKSQGEVAEKMAKSPVLSDEYLRFIVEELKPKIDAEFSTLSNAKNTFIAGSSMGGLISMYAMCEYPQIFGNVICMSTHWIGFYSDERNPIPDLFYEYLNDNLPQASKHKIYFDFGTEQLDAMYEKPQHKINLLLEQKGYFKDNLWLTKKFNGHEHNEKAWNSRLYYPLKFMLSK